MGKDLLGLARELGRAVATGAAAAGDAPTGGAVEEFGARWGSALTGVGAEVGLVATLALTGATDLAEAA